jgi:mannose-6-phosphate isomerase-like protein (cupin superfamily)
MLPKVISFQEKFEEFSSHWSPKIIAQMNDYHFKLVKVKGDFTWHDHKDTDEVFIILEGELRIDFRDGSIMLRNGEMAVIPMGVEHKPYSASECKMLLIEPAGTLNTGDAGGEQTAQAEWI